ncbi:M28 family metallopeptidase [Bacteroidota bacterium]
MAKISGGKEIIPGTKLHDRSSLENRKISRSYFTEVFRKLGYEALVQSYSDEGENIYVILKASRPSDEYIVLGAHYDSPKDSPGANDNGTGVAVVLAAAQCLNEIKDRSKNFIFVLFDQEERGLVGSRNFAGMINKENMNVHSAHTIDQMGWDNDGDRAIELEIPYDGASKLYENAAKALNMELQIHITKVSGSDHYAFRKFGYKAVGLTEEYRNGDTTPHFHLKTDTYETINFNYLESSTKLIIKAMEMLVE